jgi:hypothetical protein
LSGAWWWLRRLRQEDQEFEANLGHIVKPSKKKEVKKFLAHVRPWFLKVKPEAWVSPGNFLKMLNLGPHTGPTEAEPAF